MLLHHSRNHNIELYDLLKLGGPTLVKALLAMSRFILVPPSGAPVNQTA